MSKIKTDINLEYRTLDQIKGWDRNPRGIKKEAFERLKNQIVKLGVYKPLLVDQDDVVIGGNMRLRALQELGVDKVAVIVRDVKSEAERIEIALSDNDRAGYYEEEALAELVLSEADVDQELFSIDIGEAKPLEDVIQELSPEDEIEEDEVPEVQEEYKSEVGKIYKLGDHRLLCGDATNGQQIEMLMGSVRADLYLTDPPYNVDYEGKTKEKLKIENDKKDDVEFQAFLADSFRTAGSVMKAGAAFYIWHADSEGFNFRAAAKAVDFDVRQCLIWVKNSMVMGRQDYQWKHEPCLYGWKSGGAHSWYSDRKQTTVLNFDRPTRNGEHPTMKPLNLLAYQIGNNTKKGDVILDTFLGSGSTLIAAHQSGRVCYGSELDPRYVDVIRRRYWKLINDDDETGWEDGTPAIN